MMAEFLLHNVLAKSDVRHIMNAQPYVFIIEEDDAVRDGLEMIVENAGYTQQSFDNIEHFFKAYEPGTPGCLILDANESGMTNLELQDELRHRHVRVPIIFLKRYGESHKELSATNFGRSAVLTKPVQIEVLLKTIQALLRPETNITGQDGIDVP
jgi:FixJ family two-component response regulator